MIGCLRGDDRNIFNFCDKQVVSSGKWVNYCYVDLFMKPGKSILYFKEIDRMQMSN